MKRLLIVGLVMLVVACTDAERSRLASYGEEGEITCYSANQVVYKGESTGKINANAHIAGFEFREKGTGDFIRISADCVVRHD